MDTLNKAQTEIGTWGQLAESLYDFLNRRNTTIEYAVDNMEIAVPKEHGADSAKAHWAINGMLRIRTGEGQYKEQSED